jgi:hypothetical protein
MNTVDLYVRSVKISQGLQKVQATGENLDTVNWQRLCVDAISLDNGKAVAIDGEDIIGIT